MKTKLATLALLGASVCCVAVLAQNNPAPDENVRKLYSQPAGAAAAEAPAEAAVVEPGEVLPLVQFEDAPLVDVIKTLARQANLNLIFDPRVVAPTAEGKTAYPPVSIRLENVTAQNVLEAVLNNNSLRLERDPKTKISRVTVKDPAAAEPLVTKIYQLKFTSPSNLVTAIKPTIGTPKAQVIPDARSSQLIVLATEKDLLGVDELVQKLDTATKQVLIEAKILETTKNPSTARGINWEQTFSGQEVKFGNGIPAGTSRRSGTNGLNQLLSSTDPLLLMDTDRGLNPKYAFLDASGVRATLSWFNQDNATEMLATPRTVTADNEPAVLSVTRALPIFKVSTGGTQTGPTVDITYTNIGISLIVTPRISANNNVALKVAPEVSSVEAERDVQTVAGLANTANIYAIRRAETRVLIPSGNTLVMGGMIMDTLNRQKTKVPVLGDLPLLGQAFRSSAKQRDKRNLVIFVTPTIVTDDDFTPSTSAADFLKKQAPEDSSEFYDPEFDKKNILDSVEPYDWSQPVY